MKKSQFSLPFAAAMSMAAHAAFPADWISATDFRRTLEPTSFCRAVTNRAPVANAVWRTSGLGVYCAFVNGVEVGGFLKPGFTHFSKCRHVYSFDVTGKLKRAAQAVNVLSATVTAGWWRDEIVEPSNPDALPFEDELGVPDDVLGAYHRRLERNVPEDADNAFWGELAVEYADGTKETFGTDVTWGAARVGALRSASIYDGETYDARVCEDWRRTGRTGGWPRAKRDFQFRGEMRPASAPVVLREDLAFEPRELHLVRGAVGVSSNSYGIARTVAFFDDGEAIRIRPGEELVVDFGQNAAAVCDFDVEGAAGCEMSVRHAEMLNEGGGAKGRGNDGPEGTPYVANLRGIPAAIRYTMKAGRQRYRPAYSFFGFRYIGIRASAPMVLHRVRSVPVTSVTREMETGSLATGVPAVNRLVSNIRWGMYSNYLSVPTDCPQRNERVGWSGDTLAFLGAAVCNADVSGFLSKWLADMRDAQRADGAYRAVAPPGLCGSDRGMSGWADAGVLVTHRLWTRYGDVSVVRENWAAMERYLGCLERNGGHLTNRCGDWLSYERNDEPVKRLIADALFFEDARRMAEMAGALGKADAARRYRRLADALRGTWRARHLDAAGEVREDVRTQTTLAYALKEGLVEGAARAATARQLVENIHAHGDRLQTGFLGTAHLLDVLSDNGAHELAVTLLLQRKEPSWLYSVDQGATTVWERWNSYTKEKGFGPVSMNSFNHYAYGAVLGWMYASLAGIREDPGSPGMARFVLAPRPDARLGSVSARYRSRHGVIESSWKYEADGTLVWRYAIPEGTEATVWVPGASAAKTCKAGAHEARVSLSSAERVRPIGGLTKVFTSALALTCVADGKMSLDASLRAYLGPQVPDVTVRQALSCTAGFRKGHVRYPANAIAFEENFALAARERPVAEPGTAFEYGPWGYCLVAKAIEIVTGRPFAEALESRILKPYGLTDTTFNPKAGQRLRIAAADRKYAWLKVPETDDCEWCAVDCGLFSTEGDLLRFGNALSSDPRMRPLFEKQTPPGVDRAFSFGLNLLPSGEAFFRSASGCELRARFGSMRQGFRRDAAHRRQASPSARQTADVL